MDRSTIEQPTGCWLRKISGWGSRGVESGDEFDKSGLLTDSRACEGGGAISKMRWRTMQVFRADFAKTLPETFSNTYPIAAGPELA
jgi:hypothetical protein